MHRGLCAFYVVDCRDFAVLLVYCPSCFLVWHGPYIFPLIKMSLAVRLERRSQQVHQRGIGYAVHGVPKAGGTYDLRKYVTVAF